MDKFMKSMLFLRTFLQATAGISAPSLVCVRKSDLGLILVTQKLPALDSK